MDRNSFIGILLIGLIVILFSLYNQPDKKNTESNNPVTNTVNEKKLTSKIDELSSSIQENKEEITPDTNTNQLTVNESPFLQNTNEEKFITIENELIKLTFSNKGGRIYRSELKGFKTYNGNPVVLFDGKENKFEYQFIADNKTINTHNLFFSDSIIYHNNGSKSISLRAYIDRYRYIEQLYSLKSDGYVVDYQLNFVGLNNIISANTNYINLNWKAYLLNQEKSLENERNATTAYYKYLNEDPDYLSERSAKEEEKLTTSIKWVSFKQQFFNTTLIAQNAFEEGLVEYETGTNADYIKQLHAEFVLPYNHAANYQFPMQFYMGPNQYNTLKDLNIALDKIVPLGWGIFRWVNKFFIIPVFDFLNSFISNYGVIILIMTILIKLILSPFTYKSYISSAKMKVLQPELAVFKEKYGNDPQRLNAEQLKLYRSAGVNPLGGCLPMLLQMPILIAMYSFFPSSIELRQESFLWADDLSTYDSILDLPFNLPFYGDHVSLFTLLMTVTTFLSMQANSQMTQGNPQMKIMQYIMPIMFLPIFNGLSAGLTYYYFLANVITFLQQYVIKKFIVDENVIHNKIQENKKKPKKKSSWQKRLEDYARKQQAQRKR